MKKRAVVSELVKLSNVDGIITVDYGQAAAFSRAVIGAGGVYDWTLALVRDLL
jgi:hypothetical protein